VAADVMTVLCGGPAGIAPVGWVLGPTGLFGPGTLARTDEQYAAIGKRNIFLGESNDRSAEEYLVARFVHLTHITRNEKRTEARLYDRSNNKWYRLRTTPGFEDFVIPGEKGDLRAKVVRIEARDVIFKVGDKYYSLHVDQTIEDAMKHPLTSEPAKNPAPISSAGSSVKAGK
jgi:hypothetical protein